MTERPLTQDFTDAGLEVSAPMHHAVGIDAVEKAMVPSLEKLGAARTAKISLTINHKPGAQPAAGSRPLTQ